MVNLACTSSTTHSQHNVELALHADSCVVGQNASIIHKHPNIVMVSAFHPLHPTRNTKVVNAAIWYTWCDSVDHLILMIYQAILVPEVDPCLLCPMQCRMNGM